VIEFYFGIIACMLLHSYLWISAILRCKRVWVDASKTSKEFAVVVERQLLSHQTAGRQFQWMTQITSLPGPDAVTMSISRWC